MSIYPRANFILSKIIAPIMIKQNRGLIINTTLWDDNKYISNLPYDIFKQVNNRMIYDMAIELSRFNIACIALSLGFLRTEYVQLKFKIDDYNYMKLPEFQTSESTRHKI